MKKEHAYYINVIKPIEKKYNRMCIFYSIFKLNYFKRKITFYNNILVNYYKTLQKNISIKELEEIINK